MSSLSDEVVYLEERVKKARLPEEIEQKARGLLDRLSRLSQMGGYSQEYESVARYIDWVTSLPWTETTEDILDISQAKRILDKNHYGLSQIKERILEYLAVLILKKKEEEIIRAPILCLVGLVGTGKTTLAYSIAQALGRKFVRLPFGGMGGAFQLRGQSRVMSDAEPGQVIKALRRAKAKNPVLLLDEIDRVAEETRSDIMGVLVELLDPEQNNMFIDHYIDYPIDLSGVLFVTTANNTSTIATAVLDRLEIIQMPSYTDEEKIIIGKEYILPKAIKDAGLKENLLQVDAEVWSKIVRPLGYDAGMRSLERTIEGILRKIAKKTVEEGPTKIHLNPQNIKDYLPNW
jgi:ATP-dependent Lon protease